MNLPDIYGVTEKNGVPVVCSRKVAEVFKKDHKDVLRAIDNHITTGTKDGTGLVAQFCAANFCLGHYKDRGKRYPEYTLTKDGFAFVAMGFTGVRAAQFKIAYINRFNEMESFIRNLAETKADFPEFTQAILMAHDEPKHYHFSNEIDMINRIALGMSAKQFKEAHNLGKVKSIRPYLSTSQIEAIRSLQRIDIGLVVAVPDFQERKRILTDYHSRQLAPAALA